MTHFKLLNKFLKNNSDINIEVHSNIMCSIRLNNAIVDVVDDTTMLLVIIDTKSDNSLILSLYNVINVLSVNDNVLHIQLKDSDYIKIEKC